MAVSAYHPRSEKLPPSFSFTQKEQTKRGLVRVVCYARSKKKKMVGLVALVVSYVPLARMLSDGLEKQYGEDDDDGGDQRCGEDSERRCNTDGRGGTHNEAER
jgi:hypothetical protein